MNQMHETPVPIRVHSNPHRRGRKLSDCSRSLISAAVRDIQERRRMGVPVSVREIANRYNVSKTTLHRYLRSSAPILSPSDAGSKKLDISFLIS